MQNLTSVKAWIYEIVRNFTTHRHRKYWAKMYANLRFLCISEKKAITSTKMCNFEIYFETLVKMYFEAVEFALQSTAIVTSKYNLHEMENKLWNFEIFIKTKCDVPKQFTTLIKCAKIGHKIGTAWNLGLLQRSSQKDLILRFVLRRSRRLWKIVTNFEKNLTTSYFVSNAT